MKGMKDITLVGHSKGGNLVYNYMAASTRKHAIKNAVTLEAPITNYMAFYGAAYVGLRQGIGFNPSLFDTKFVTLTSIYDPVTMTGNGPLGNTLVGATNNYDVKNARDPHAAHRSTVWANHTLMVNLNITRDHNTRTGTYEYRR